MGSQSTRGLDDATNSDGATEDGPDVKHLTLAELDRQWSEFERAVDRTPEIDRWCSGLDWVLPVHAGFGPGAKAEPLVLTDGSGWAVLARYRLGGGRRVIAGLEPLWGFASPLVGPDPGALADRVARVLAAEPWDQLVLPGMPELVSDASFPMRVATALAQLGPVGMGAGIVRQVADLDGGYEPWWARRSPRFRRNLSQAGRRAESAGLEVEDASNDPGVFERIVAVERRSWKGRDDTGITAPEMLVTYRAMTARLQARGRLRVLLARRGGADVGYILGGVRAGIYRGLQLSYAREAAELSVGHLLQHHQLRALCRHGEATTYDLGMDLGYKARWADRAVPTFTLVVNRPRRRRHARPTQGSR